MPNAVEIKTFPYFIKYPYFNKASYKQVVTSGYYKIEDALTLNTKIFSRIEHR